MRKSALFIFILFITMLLQSCAQEKKTTITLWQTMTKEESKTLALVVRQFEHENRNVIVNVRSVDFYEALPAFHEAQRVGEDPDLFRADISWIPQLAKSGAIQPLDDVWDRAEQSAFIDEALMYTKWQGKTWSIPQVVDVLALVYNRKLVERPPETWQQLEALAEPFRAQQRYALATNDGDFYWMEPFIAAFGGEVLAQDGAVQLDSREVEAAFRYVLQLKKNGALPPRSDYAEMNRGFNEERYAMIIQGPWQVKELLDGTANTIGVAPLPRGRNGGTGTPIGGQSYTLSAKTKHRTEAVRLMKFLTSKKVQRQFAKRNFVMPTRLAVYEDEALQKNVLLQQYRRVLQDGKARPVLEEGGALFEATNPLMKAVFYEEKDVRQSLQERASEWRKILKK